MKGQKKCEVEVGSLVGVFDIFKRLTFGSTGWRIMDSILYTPETQRHLYALRLTAAFTI
jgi:hypothetical protein